MQSPWQLIEEGRPSSFSLRIFEKENDLIRKGIRFFLHYKIRFAGNQTQKLKCKPLKIIATRRQCVERRGKLIIATAYSNTALEAMKGLSKSEAMTCLTGIAQVTILPAT